MKKYLLDKRYRKVTYRLCIVLLVVVGLALMEDAEFVLFQFFTFVAAIWIFAAEPEE